MYVSRSLYFEIRITADGADDRFNGVGAILIFLVTTLVHLLIWIFIRYMFLNQFYL